MLSLMSTRNSGVAEAGFARTYLPGQVQRAYAFDIGYDAFGLKYFDRHLYTCDLAVNQIIGLDTSGREMARLGKKGMAAGSFNHIIGWGIDATGLYVADPSNRHDHPVQPGGCAGPPIQMQAGHHPGHAAAGRQLCLKIKRQHGFERRFPGCEHRHRAVHADG
jgi:hypothetical protein